MKKYSKDLENLRDISVDDVKELFKEENNFPIELESPEWSIESYQNDSDLYKLDWSYLDYSLKNEVEVKNEVKIKKPIKNQDWSYLPFDLWQEILYRISKLIIPYYGNIEKYFLLKSSCKYFYNQFDVPFDIEQMNENMMI